ncbi:Uncharacterised protein [uncultured archaeon]|nr:Uncharacterised protein [uncultured archaeon]
MATVSLDIKDLKKPKITLTRTFVKQMGLYGGEIVLIRKYRREIYVSIITKKGGDLNDHRGW